MLNTLNQLKSHFKCSNNMVKTCIDNSPIAANTNITKLLKRSNKFNVKNLDTSFFI